MANEITPGMNMQARKPVDMWSPNVNPDDPWSPNFAPTDPWSPNVQPGMTLSGSPTPDGAIPMQPTSPATPKLKSIREYLQALQPGQVPTFTNIPGQEGQFSEGNAAVFQEIGQSPGGPITPYPDQQGAIPEKPEDKPVEGKDPYEKAKNALPRILPDLKEQFDMKYGNNTSLEEYDNLWAQAVNHANNQLIKSFEKEDDEKEKQGLKFFKDYTKTSIDEWKRTGDLGALRERIDVQKISSDAFEKWAKWAADANKDDDLDEKVLTGRSMIEQFPTAEAYAAAKVEAITKSIENYARTQIERDRTRRGAGTPQAGAQKQVPPELQGRYDEAKAKGIKLMLGGMSEEEAKRTLAADYEDIVPFF